jgi:hypothetical protein
VEGDHLASARLRGAQCQDPVFGNMCGQNGQEVLVSGGPDTGLVVTAVVEGVRARHVLHPNMDGSPESGDGPEVQAGEKVRFLRGIVPFGEHVGSNVAPLEGAAFEWPGNLSMKVRDTIVCIYVIHYFKFKFAWTHKIRF